MKCSKCGKEVQEEWEYCRDCGEKIKSDEGDIKKEKNWKKNIKEFFFSKTFIIYTIIALIIIVYNYYNLRDTSFFISLGLYCYLTVLCFVIFPIWIINKNLTNKQMRDEIEPEMKEDINKEYRKKCNVCGNVFCYTEKDIHNNNARAKSANKYRISMITQGLMNNNKIDWRYNQEKMEQELSKIVDFSKCPKCGSTDLIDYNGNQIEEKVNMTNADEIIKYKELLDKGILTKEEFEKKKRELLNL